MPAPRNEISRLVSTFRDASSLRWATSSGSDSGDSSASARPSLTPAGICSKSSSTESTPIASSICPRSCSVRERKLIPGRELLLFEEPAVVGRVEQRVDLAAVSEADPHQPPLSVRILVDGFRRLDNLLVDLDELPRERRDQVRDRLHRLDLAVGVVLADPDSFVGRLEVDELAERVLSEPRDSERRLVTLDPRPVVFRVVLEVVGVRLSHCHRVAPPACR